MIRELPFDHPREAVIIGGALQIVHTENAGIAAGLLLGSTAWVVVAIVGAALAGLIVLTVARGARQRLWLPGGIVLGGTLSNIIDRVRYGAVTDSLVIGSLRPTNIADLAILAGGLGLLVLVLQGSDRTSAGSAVQHRTSR